MRLPRILLLLPLLPAGAASEAGAAEEAAEEPIISAIRLPERLSLSLCAEPTEAASETEAEASLWGQSPSPSDDESPCKEACKETEGGEDELTLVLHSPSPAGSVEAVLLLGSGAEAPAEFVAPCGVAVAAVAAAEFVATVDVTAVLAAAAAAVAVGRLTSSVGSIVTTF